MQANTPEAISVGSGSNLLVIRGRESAYWEIKRLKDYCLVKEEKAVDPEAECAANW